MYNLQDFPMDFTGGGCTQYFIDDEWDTTWDEANEYCQKNGGNLVKIEHKLQQQCLNEFLYEIGGNIN